MRINCLLYFCIFFSLSAVGQGNFRKEFSRNFFYHACLGVGAFFPTPRPTVSSIFNQIMPGISLGVGKQLSPYLSVKTTFNSQSFSSKEYYIKPDGSSALNPLLSGFNNAIDITPSINLFPIFDKKQRSAVNFQIGIGLGYLLNYKTERFVFSGKVYNFSFLTHSPYIPVRSSLTYQKNTLSELSLEAAFFHTWLNPNSKLTVLRKNSDHFGQLNIVYRRFISLGSRQLQCPDNQKLSRRMKWFQN
jgi:hypothetical protein